MNKKFLAVTVLGFLFLGGCTPTASTPDDAATPTPSAPTTETPSTTANVKEFTVSGANFTFTPSNMAVKKGDTVKITFKNVEGFHDLKIDEFNAATKQLQAGASETITFVADKVGSFEYYCTVGKHREMGMKGTLVVQ